MSELTETAQEKKHPKHTDHPFHKETKHQTFL